MSKMPKKNIILWVFFIFALGGISLALVIISKWNKPLGPSLDLPTITHSTTPVSVDRTLVFNSVITLTQVNNFASPETSHPSPNVTRQPLCGGQATMTILLIGSDQRGRVISTA